jgi:hypothetical protein
MERDQCESLNNAGKDSKSIVSAGLRVLVLYCSLICGSSQQDDPMAMIFAAYLVPKS